MYGKNDYLNELRWLTSIELYQNAEYYSKHPLLHECQVNNREWFPNYTSVFTICLSEDVFDSFMDDKNYTNAIKNEAIRNLQDHKYSSFMCLLALANVIGTDINSFYPEIGPIRYKTLINCTIKPRQNEKCRFSSINIMFSRLGASVGMFKPNHFVPLITEGSLKRNPKRKMISKTDEPPPKITKIDLTKSTITKSTKVPSQKVPSKTIFFKNKTVSKSTNSFSSLSSTKSNSVLHSNLNNAKTIETSSLLTKKKESSINKIQEKPVNTINFPIKVIDKSLSSGDSKIKPSISAMKKLSSFKYCKNEDNEFTYTEDKEKLLKEDDKRIDSKICFRLFVF